MAKIFRAFFNYPASIIELGLSGMTLNMSNNDCIMTVTPVIENINLQKN